MDKVLILREIKKRKGFASDKEFAESLGISPQNLAKWYERKTFDVDKVFASFPDLSAEWLLSGEGNMIKCNEQMDSQTESDLRYTISVQKDLIEKLKNDNKLLLEQLSKKVVQQEESVEDVDAKLSAVV